MDEHPEEERGKCWTCGFATKRVTIEDGSRSAPTFLEISSAERFEGDVELLGGSVSHYGQVLGSAAVFVELACFRGVAELREGNTAEELHRDRGCPYWYSYIAGFSPQRHLEDFRMQQLEDFRARTDEIREQNRRAFEERMDRDRQAFDERLTKSDQEFQTRREVNRLEFDKAIQKQNRTLLILGIILAFVVGVAQFLGTFLAARMNSRPAPPIEQPSQPNGNPK